MSRFKSAEKAGLTFGVLGFLFVGFCSVMGQGLPVALPQRVGMNAAKLSQIDGLVNADISSKKLPGAVVLVGHRGKIVFRRAYGNRSLVPAVEPMTVDTIFDLASLTKPIATATSIMILVEKGKLRLSDTVGQFVPEIQDETAKKITVQQLLTHTGGYAPDFNLKEKWSGHEGMLQALYKEKLRSPPGTKFVYSDIGFIVLGEIGRRVAGILPEFFFLANISTPLGMLDSGYSIFGETHPKGGGLGVLALPIMPRTDPQNRVTGGVTDLAPIAPTENIKGRDSYLGSRFDGDEKTGSQVLRGQVHDPTAFRMDGVAGHAGVFSTADDLARYCQMILGGGSLGGKRIMSAQTVRRMTAPIVVSESGDTRTLGWDMNTSYSSNRGELFPLGSFGHTGFTGTGIWIDPVSQTFVVFLSNRVHPDGKGDVGPLRAKIATVVASAVEDTPVEKYRGAEAEYMTMVAVQTARFRVADAMTAKGPAEVFNGIDVLERDKFKQLDGLRVGLVTNHTGRNLAGRQTIDILKETPNVKLTALFAPEHGIRGLVDDKVSDSVDEKTGLPIYSLYGETRRPRPEQLKDLDAIVYDVQDIGTRFYTYPATLKNVLEEAAKAGKPVFVLDRPDPLGGVSVEGPLADEDKLNFIAAHTTPVRYGMTIGELGMMMNAERKIGADLRVIKMDGWSRSMWFDETGQTWINPSPNMRSLTQATLYPGIGLLEASNVSVGRGTDTPFELVGAPWLDGRKLALYLNMRNIRGVRFIPVRFRPNASKFKDEDCGGVNIVVVDRNAFNSVRTGWEIAAALRKLYPREWEVEKYSRLVLNQTVYDMVKLGEQPDAIEAAANKDRDEFIKRRSGFLLYR